MKLRFDRYITGRICDWIFGCAPKNSCVIAPVRRKTQSTVQLTSDYTYELELERRCMFNWSFHPMDSTNSNVLYRFDVLLHPRLFCFVITPLTHANICYERNTYFLHNGRSCRTFSFNVNQNKNSAD